MTHHTPSLTISAEWEHPLVAAHHGTTNLIVRIDTTHPDTMPDRQPIDIAFALDRSGSMHGDDKIELVKEAVIAASHMLSDRDHVALVTFDNEIDTVHSISDASLVNRSRLESVTREITARGSTNLFGGWVAACQQLSNVQHAGSGRPSRALLLTDGMANVGETNPSELARHAAELRTRGITTSTTGVGRHFDEFLLAGMCEAGGGTFEWISNVASLQAFFEREIGELQQTVALRPKLRLRFPSGMRAELINQFPVARHGKTISVDIRDLSAGEKIALVFAVTVQTEHTHDLEPTMELTWYDPQQSHESGRHEEIPGLRVGTAEEAARTTRNDTAAEIAALEHSAKEQREAIRLDREGRYQESRERFREASSRLMAAPQSARVREEAGVALSYMKRDMAAPLSEDDRKSRVQQVQRRSRGKRDGPQADSQR